MPTLVIDNFSKGLTRYAEGDINSGLGGYGFTFANDPYSSPGNLTWFEEPTRIDPNESVITDLIMAARPRLESGITYVYAIGHTGRLYKIQVNDPTTRDPDFDSPVLLATLSTGTPTFKYGSSIQFYGATEKIFIGHDKGVTKINFDGTSETVVGVAGSYTASVPRPSVQFAGKLYFGNGTNLVEIDSTELVISYAKLSPGFPSGTQVRDIDVSPDGNYVQIVVSRISQADMTVITQDTSSLSSADSYFIYWNGVTAGYTAYNPYNSYAITASTSFGQHSYTTGYDLGGAALYTGGEKLFSFPNALSPNFGAMFSTGNVVGFCVPEQDAGSLAASLFIYGKYDKELPEGLHRFFRIFATDQTDIQQIPTCTVVSNLFYGASSAGYAGNKIGSAKLYFSTLETDSGPTTKYKLYKFTTVPTGAGLLGDGFYDTQCQVFSKKVTIKEVRLYCEPLVASNSFEIYLIKPNGDAISGGNKAFTVGTNVTAGEDLVRYNPAIDRTYAFGVRIINTGTVNWVGSKIEVDYEDAGS